MRVRYKPWAEDYLRDHSELVDMDGQHAGEMTEWFDKTQSIHIETGSDMGQFIITLVVQNPHINYISMEHEKSIVYKVLDRVKEMGLTNLKIICNGAIELSEYFKNGEVSRIYLNFSGPWPKNRRAKRCLTYHTFLTLYQQILNDEGDLHFKTDNRGLFAYSLESMSRSGMYFTKINLNLHQEDDGSNILTEYEKKSSDKGSRIYRIEAKLHS